MRIRLQGAVVSCGSPAQHNSRGHRSAEQRKSPIAHQIATRPSEECLVLHCTAIELYGTVQV